MLRFIQGVKTLGNYCYGTITCTGPRDTLDLLHVLCQRLDECADISGYDADIDWLGHVFVNNVPEYGIFCEGCGWDGNNWECSIRASRTDGEDFFQKMADGLGLTIEWEYVSDYDDEEHTKLCIPRSGATPWNLRTEDSLDEDGEDHSIFGQPSSNSPTLPPMDLSAAIGARGIFTWDRDAEASAKEGFIQALDKLKELHPVVFTQIGTFGESFQFVGITYHPMDDKFYVQLRRI